MAGESTSSFGFGMTTTSMTPGLPPPPAVVGATLFTSLAIAGSAVGYLATRDEFQTGPTGPPRTKPLDVFPPTGPTGRTGASYISFSGQTGITGPDGFRGPSSFNTGPTGPTGVQVFGPTGVVMGPEQNLGIAGVTLHFSDGVSYNEDFSVSTLNYGPMSVLVSDGVSLTRPSITGPNPIFMSFSTDVNTTYKGAMATFQNVIGVRYNPYEVLSLASDDNGRFFTFVFNNVVTGLQRFLTWDDAGSSIIPNFLLIIGNNT